MINDDLERLANRGPTRNPEDVVDDALAAAGSSPRFPARSLVAGVAVVLVAGLVIGLAASRDTDESVTVNSSVFTPMPAPTLNSPAPTMHLVDDTTDDDTDSAITPAPTSTSVPAPVTTPPSAVSTTIAQGSTDTAITPTPPTTAGNPDGVLEFVDGALLGIRQGSLLTEAADAFELTPVRLSDLGSDPPVQACIGTPDPWVIRTGGLTLFFEGDSASAAVLTNWTHTGGPVAGFTEIVAPNDLHIGDARAEVVQANPDHTDYGDEIHVGSPFYLRYGIRDDVVTWFGIIDCAFAQNPTD